MQKKTLPRQNRIRETLGRLYDQHPPHFREYVRRFEEDPTSRVFAPLAEAYRRMGRLDEAIEICKTGLEHHPDFHGGHVALAKCYIDKKKLPEALKELDWVLQSVPENLLAQRLTGDSHLMMGNKSLAVHAYKMALLLSPTDVALNEKVHQLELDLEQESGLAVLADKTSQAAQTEDLPVLKPIFGLPEEEREEEVSAGNLIQQDLPDEYVVSSLHQVEEEVLSDPQIRSEINALLGVNENETEDDSFKVEHVSSIFSDLERDNRKEITTETLGDLYFLQEQYRRSLEIFEKLASQKPSTELNRKIFLCREKLGVDRTSMVRNRKIETLRLVLKRSREMAERV